jgi:hypothetical protein
MKLMVYEDKEKQEEVVRLRLVEEYDGVLALQVVDEAGVRKDYGTILRISENKITRERGATAAPWPRDEDDRVIIS